VDEQDSAWSSGFFGTVLQRDAAIRHPLAKEVYNLVDHALRCDELLKAYLA
jgi:hypothetical protein